MFATRTKVSIFRKISHLSRKIPLSTRHENNYFPWLSPENQFPESTLPKVISRSHDPEFKLVFTFPNVIPENTLRISKGTVDENGHLF